MLLSRRRHSCSSPLRTRSVDVVHRHPTVSAGHLAVDVRRLLIHEIRHRATGPPVPMVTMHLLLVECPHVDTGYPPPLDRSDTKAEPVNDELVSYVGNLSSYPEDHPCDRVPLSLG